MLAENLGWWIIERGGEFKPAEFRSDGFLMARVGEWRIIGALKNERFLYSKLRVNRIQWDLNNNRNTR